MQKESQHIAQVNIAKMLAPLESEVMSGFVSKLEEINKLAECSPGFIWRLKSDDGDATSIRVYEDDMILINLSIWENVEDLKKFVYKGDHREVLNQRKSWFEKFDGFYTALWWIKKGHIPTAQEAKERLEYLNANGPSNYSFNYSRIFEPEVRDIF